jgi:hypothetical protein
MSGRSQRQKSDMPFIAHVVSADGIYRVFSKRKLRGHSRRRFAALNSNRELSGSLQVVLLAKLKAGNMPVRSRQV